MNRFHCPCHCETTMQPQQQTQKQMSMAAHLQEPRWPGFGFRGLNHLLHKNLQWGTNQRQHQKYKTTMHKFASVHHRGTALSHTLTPSGIYIHIYAMALATIPTMNGIRIYLNPKLRQAPANHENLAPCDLRLIF